MSTTFKIAAVNLLFALAPMSAFGARIVIHDVGPTYNLNGQLDGPLQNGFATLSPTFRPGLGRAVFVDIFAVEKVHYLQSTNTYRNGDLPYEIQTHGSYDFSKIGGSATVAADGTDFASQQCHFSQGCAAFKDFPRDISYYGNQVIQTEDFLKSNYTGSFVFAYTFKTTKILHQVDGSAPWTLKGNIELFVDYLTKSTAEYVADAVKGTKGTDADRAKAAYVKVINLRETSAATSEKNLQLRDAEYYLRGYAGGSSNSNLLPIDPSKEDPLNEIANRTGPLATAIYNAKKFWEQGYGIDTPAPGEFPQSPPGGFDQNLQGFQDGLNGVPLDDAIGNLDPNAPETPFHKVPSLIPLEPTRPSIDITYQDQQEINFFNFTPAETAETYYFDPTPGEIMAYGITGNRFISILLPEDSPYNELALNFPDHKINLTPGELIDLKLFSPDGIDGFYISGGPKFDPKHTPFVLGLGFLSTSEALMTAISLDAPVPVSLLPSAVFLASGLLTGLGSRMRPQKFSNALG